MIGVVVPGFCNGTICYRRWLGFRIILHTQEGAVLQVIPHFLVLFIISRHEEVHRLKPLGAIVFISPHVGLDDIHVCRDCSFF